jgi:hypothetical protein
MPRNVYEWKQKKGEAAGAAIQLVDPFVTSWT